MSTFEEWWMDWAFRHQKYSLGEAVKAAWKAGQLYEVEKIYQEIRGVSQNSLAYLNSEIEMLSK